MNVEHYYSISRQLLEESRWQRVVAQALAVTGNTPLSERLLASSERLETLAQELTTAVGEDVTEDFNNARQSSNAILHSVLAGIELANAQNQCRRNSNDPTLQSLPPS